MEATGSDKVVLKCKHCLSEFEMRKKDLRKVAEQHQGWVPCRYCGSHNTTWDLNAGVRN